MKPKVKITAEDIDQALRNWHNKDLCLSEVRLSSGFQWEGRVDFLAMNPSPASGNKTTAYEIKVSRRDFKKDSHDKQRGARLYSDMFYYVAPKGIISTEEIPDWAGLIEVEWGELPGNRRYLKLDTAVPAPKRDKEPPSWGLVCSMMRNAHKNGI